MRIDCCRKCGTELELEKKCFTCNKPIAFRCKTCKSITDEQIHFDCMYNVIQVSVAG